MVISNISKIYQTSQYSISSMRTTIKTCNKISTKIITKYKLAIVTQLSARYTVKFLITICKLRE